MKIILRIFIFILLVALPAMFAWWLYFPLAVVYVYKVKSPYEILLASSFLDRAFFSGSSFWNGHELFFFSVLLLTAIMIFANTLEWRRSL